MGAGRGLIDIVRLLIMTLIKSVLATVVGKENTKAITGAAHGMKDNLKSMGHGTVEVVKKGGCCSRQGSKVSGDLSPSSVSTRSKCPSSLSIRSKCRLYLDTSMNGPIAMRGA